MRNNTPPSSPFFERGDRNEDDEIEDDDEDDELIYVGDADEVLNQLEQQVSDDDDDNEREDFNDVEQMNEQDYVPLKDDAFLTFTGHTGPVFCGSLHPTQQLAVTGGEDDRAFVWSTETGNVVFNVTGHKDSVVAAEFSPDGNYLATGDMAGFIQVFKLPQDYKLVWEFEMGDLSWLKWHTAANVLLGGADSGETYVWRIPSGDCKVLQGNGDKSECGALTADGKSLIVGYADGTVKLWDIKSSSVLQEISAGSALGHTEAITSIVPDPDNGRFLTGSEDGKILIANNSGPLSNLFPNAGSIEALSFCMEDELKLVACGTLQGKVSLWDVNRQAVRVECQNFDDTGITKIAWAPTYTLLCATLEGSVRGFDGRSGERKVRNKHYLIDTCPYFTASSFFFSTL